MLALLGALVLPFFALLAPARCQTPQKFEPVEGQAYHLVTEIEGFGLDKRLTPYFITVDGRATYDCHAATTFMINPNQQLVAGNGQIYATNYGVTSQQFVPTQYPGSISSTWAISSSNIVSWNNPSFLNGVAVACVDQYMNVQIYFTASPPASCTILTFHIAGASICPPSSTAPGSVAPAPSTTPVASQTPSVTPKSVTPSVTPVSVTPSVTPSATPTGSGRTPGLAFRAYPVYTSNTTGSAFSPLDFRSQCYPWQYGVADRLNFNNSADYYCYPAGFGAPINCQNMVAVYQGYFFANISGTYKFASTDTEDYFWVWQTNALGAAWSDSNKDMLGQYQQPASVSFTFNANSYNPFTFMWVSQQPNGGPALVDFQVTFPGGMQSTVVGPYMSLPTASEFDCPYPVAGASSWLDLDQYFTGLGFRGYLGDDTGSNVDALNSNCAYNTSGTAYNLDFYVADDSGNCYPPGALQPQNCSAYRAIYQGYFYPIVDGSYTFSTAQPEDFLGLWIGTNASAKSWTSNNYLFETGSTPGPANGTVTLKGGTYTPITIIAINFKPVYNDPGFNIDLRVLPPGVPNPVNPSPYFYRPQGTSGEFDCPYNTPTH